MRNIVLFFLLNLILIFSCRKDEVEHVNDMGYDYFPIEKGVWVQYDVDSIVWNDFYDVTDPRFIDTFQFQIREVIDTTFIDNIGREAQRIVRYKRFGDTTEWFVKDVWYQVRTESVAEKVEENQRIIKLAFPVRDNVSWNGNAFNSMPAWEFEYDDINQSMMLGGLSFDSTLVVKQVDDLSLISKVYGIEKYAKNVGMIYREYINLKTNPVNNEITSGLKYKLVATNWGNNK